MARWSARADWRLWLALLASLLAHLLWLTPDWAWLPAPARDEPPAAPLTARLQVLAAPTAAAKLAQAPAASPAAPLAQLAKASAPTRGNAKKQPTPSPADAVDADAVDAAGQTAPESAPVAPTPAAPAEARFPARVSLRYEVFYGSLMAGIGELDWQGGEGQYRLELTLRSLFAPRLRYVSEGELNANGLKPLRFDAYRGDTRREHAEFDWAAGELRYGDRDEQRTELQAGAQDILSLVFQLALRAGALEGQTVQMTSGKKVYSQPVRIDGESEQNLAGQTLAVVQVSSEARGQRTEVWLAREQHNLPLRIRNSGENKLIDQRVIRVQVDGETILNDPNLKEFTMAISHSLFQHAVDALRRVLPCDKPADAALSAFFRDNHKLGQQDRHFIAESVFAVLRRHALLTALTAPQSTPKRLLIASLVRVRGHNLRELSDALTEADRKWAGELKALEPELSLAQRAELPDWVVEALQAGGMDDDTLLTLGRAMQHPAPLDLRVNTLKTRREDALAALQAAGISAEATPLSPFGLRVKGKPALTKMPLFTSGQIEVQDEGSQLLGLLLAPRRGEMVVDFCAGAGGKTLLLGAMMASTGRLYAFDISEKRLANLKPRLARSGLSNVHPQLLASENDSRIKRLAGKIDRVLVDAPCSGLGTLRRNPDLKLRQSPDSVAQLNATQASILNAAASLVKPGGRLVYATCSLLPAENDAIVDAFLASHPEFSLLNAEALLAEQRVQLATGERLRLNPARDNTDGFFAVALTRA